MRSPKDPYGEPTSVISKSFLAPGFFVELGKRDFAISLVDSIHPRLALGVQEALGLRAIGSRDAVLFVGYGLASIVKQLEFDPVAGLFFCSFFRGRTCRVV